MVSGEGGHRVLLFLLVVFHVTVHSTHFLILFVLIYKGHFQYR